jgi:hypothetical protein
MLAGVKDHTMTQPLKMIGALVYTTHVCDAQVQVFIGDIISLLVLQMAAVGGEIVVVRMARAHG